MNKKIPFPIAIIIIVVVAILIGGFIIFYKACNGCIIPKSSEDETELINDEEILNLEQILSNPEKYDGKDIKISCYYYESFEKVVLTHKVFAHEGGARSVSPLQVWAMWQITPPEDLYNKLEELPGIGGEPDFYGQVEVEGTFHIAKNGTGHMGDYKYYFEISDIVVLDNPSDSSIEQD